jgi:hypothetical protein
MVNRITDVAVSDTRGVESSNATGYIKLLYDFEK